MSAPTAHELDLDRLLGLYAETAARWAAEGHESIADIKTLAVGAALIDPDTLRCDGCDPTYSVAVLEAADVLIPPSATAYDANGDPDVTICGFCILDYEANRDAAEDAAMLAADTAAREVHMYDDEADTIAATDMGDLT